MTFIIVLGSSLFVALVINPVFASKFVKKDERATTNKNKLKKISIYIAILAIVFYLIGFRILGSLCLIFTLLNLLNGLYLTPLSHLFQDKFLVRLERRYSKILNCALMGRQPLKLLAGTFGLLIFSIVFFALMKPNVEFFPVNEPKYINVFLEMPEGTDVVTTDSLARIVEQKVTTILKPYQQAVSSVLTNVGAGTSDPNEMGGAKANTPNKARITINFVEFKYRQGVKTGDVMKELSASLVGVPGVDISVDKNRDGPPMGRPINMEISGDNFDQLLLISEDIQQLIEQENIAGIEGLRVDLEMNKAELLVNIDRDITRRMGISTAQVGSTIRTALFGKEVSKFKDGEDEYPIRIRLADKYRYDVSSLMNQRITFRSQSNGRIMQIPVSSVADYNYNNTYGSVNRKNMKRQVTLYSNVIEGFNENLIIEQLKKLLIDYPIPDGYDLQFTGKQQEQEQTQDFLSKALMIAIALITLILVSQFNSALKPIIIIMTVLFSTIGVFLGLAIFNMDFVIIMTGIGIVSLAGIVVNNAIVLIDYIDLLKSRKRQELGLEKDAKLNTKFAVECIKKAGQNRLRPVLLTAITTVLGLLPLATGMNINFTTLLTEFNPRIFFGGDNAIFWGPMAWTVIFGLTFATFLTLVIVPVMYLLADKMTNRFLFFLKK